jgi:hypothetical protein
MAPFQPIGDRARWRVIYDMLTKADVDDVITYEQIGTALGLDPEADRHIIQMAMRRAAREHEVSDNRAIDVIPNTGYVIVQAPEHLTLARRHQKKSTKALERGHSKVVHVDLSGMEPETRRAFEVVARAFTMQMDFNRRFDVRQARLEEAIGAMTERTERTEEEIAELKRRLARLEGDDGTREGGNQ